MVLDEIQLRPDLFPILRVLSDRETHQAQFLILGSASPDLIKGTAQSLAGRVETIEVTPFSLPEVRLMQTHWVRGDILARIWPLVMKILSHGERRLCRGFLRGIFRNLVSRFHRPTCLKGQALIIDI